jgi:Na+/melibiose symporter-like transporter
VALTLALIYVAVERGTVTERRGRRIDVVGALLTALGLAAPVFALVEQPERGWTSPVVVAGLVGGAILLAAFVAWERRHRDPMLPLALFRSRNFSVTNAETLLVYAALSSLVFFLTIFLQTVAGYSALKSGLAGLPTTILLFLLSGRFGALAGRFGPRLFMGVGPVVAAVGVLLLLRLDESVGYFADLLPAILVFGTGLALTVAPLTATVMAEAHRGDSGIASAQLDLSGFRLGMALTASLLAAGGLIGLFGIRNRPGAAEAPVLSSRA